MLKNALMPVILLALAATAANAGEISEDRLVDDFPADAEVQTPPPAGAKPVNKTGDRSGWEPINPTYTGDGYGGGYDGSSSISECQSLRYRNKCYFLALSQESWHTARDYCNRIGYTLARIHSSDEATFLASYLFEGGHNNYWIDLNDERTEGVWTYSDNSPGFTDWWGPNEPNGNRGENCGLLGIGRDRIGRLVDEPCGEWRRYICQRQSENVCRRAGYKRKCYWFSVTPLNWFAAREYCATMGQRLARVTATDELNFLARIMPRNSWFDLRHGGQGVGWTYTDGSNFNNAPSFFGDGFANFMGPQCAELRRYNQKEGRSYAVDCNLRNQFICESTSLPSGAEMDNPEDLPGSLIGTPMGNMGMGGMGGMGMPMAPGVGGYGMAGGYGR